MNKFCRSLILMLLVLVSLPAMAAETSEEELGFWFEAQAISKNPSRLLGQYQRDLVGSFGLFVFVEQDSDGYEQYYLGPKWRPAEWLELGIGIGRETVPDEFTATRRAFFFSANWEKVGVSGSFENGGSGAWHKVTATYAFNKRFGAGLMDETNLGLGPRLEYNIKKNVQVWGALLRNQDTKENTSVFAINFSF